MPLWLEVVLLSGVVLVAAIALAIGLADLVVTIWVQTSFVQDSKNLVTSFYLLEVLSWWPMVVQTYYARVQGGSEHPLGELSLRLLPGGCVFTALILCGFTGGASKSRAKRGCCGALSRFLGHVVIAGTLSCVCIFSNIFFF
jgi:hypothetical protein